MIPFAQPLLDAKSPSDLRRRMTQVLESDDFMMATMMAAVAAESGEVPTAPPFERAIIEETFGAEFVEPIVQTQQQANLLLQKASTTLGGLTREARPVRHEAAPHRDGKDRGAPFNVNASLGELGFPSVLSQLRCLPEDQRARMLTHLHGYAASAAMAQALHDRRRLPPWLVRALLNLWREGIENVDPLTRVMPGARAVC